MKTFSIFSGLHQVMGARGISKAVVATHLYLLLVAVMVNSILYLGVTREGFSDIYSGSVLTVPQEISEQLDLVPEAALLEGEVLGLSEKVKELETELLELSQREVAPVSPQQVIVKEVIKVIQADAPSQTTSGSRPANSPQQINETGAMIVNAQECPSGFASVTPRLVRTCVE